MTLTVLVTRPAAQAPGWVERLRALGVDARALPLMAIEPLQDTGAVRDAWRTLGRHALAMFVSPNAVAGFFDPRPEGASWPPSLRAGATGPGTREALVAAGVPHALCVAPGAPPFDSAALWSLLRGEDWSQRSALIVRGDGGRDEFAHALREAGAEVAFLQAYRRAAPRWSAAERALAEAALAAPARHLWLLSSGEAVAHLSALLPGAAWRESRALASHPRIGDKARAAGFGRVLDTAPTIEAVRAAVACLESSAP